MASSSNLIKQHRPQPSHNASHSSSLSSDKGKFAQNSGRCFFALEASDVEIVGFTRAIGEVCKLVGVQPNGDSAGFRAISNAGAHGVQEVPHLHVHILAGRRVGQMIQPA